MRSVPTFSTTRPEAGSRALSRLKRTSLSTVKSAFWAALTSSFQVRKPKPWMCCFSMFSASAERCAGAPGSPSAQREATATAIFGSPLLRMKSTRSSCDIWFSDFCTCRTLTAART